jgi:hypothetical protein
VPRASRVMRVGYSVHFSNTTGHAARYHGSRHHIITRLPPT